MQRLPIERISKASADQRKGRCGREAQGICIRLYLGRGFHRPRGIHSAGGAADQSGQRDSAHGRTWSSVSRRVSHFWIRPTRAWSTTACGCCRSSRHGCGAARHRLGRQIAALPVDPRLGRMLLAAAEHRCLTEMLVIAAFLEAQDPRERPAEGSSVPLRNTRVFADARSDFITVINLWRAFERADAAAFRQSAAPVVPGALSVVPAHARMAGAACAAAPEPAGAGAAAQHHGGALYRAAQALLTGFLGSIGHLDEKREYQGRGACASSSRPARRSRPSRRSGLSPAASWRRRVSMRAWWRRSILGGSRLRPRTSSSAPMRAALGPARASLPRSESVSLYGLILSSGRRVNYGAIAPREAREIFIREALVGGTCGDRRRVRGGEPADAPRSGMLEAKTRRRDLLAGEEQEVEFFAARCRRA